MRLPWRTPRDKRFSFPFFLKIFITPGSPALKKRGKVSEQLFSHQQMIFKEEI
jgi:hypothetical protein